MYQANVYNIMIGAPSDIQKEVQMVKDAISCWNQTNSMHRNIVLMPLHWKSNAYSSVGTSGQSVINDQVTNKSDLLVAIFGSRLGAPTEDHISGTVEEIQQHIRNNKKVMLFFRENNLSPKSEDERVQLNKLFDFKKEIQSKCLWYDYKDETTFYHEFFRQLGIWASRELNEFNAKVKNQDNQSSETKSFKLSELEQKLYYYWATSSNSNRLQFFATVFQSDVCVGGKLIELKSPREEADVNAFVNKMQLYGLAESCYGGGEKYYKLTADGYRVFEENEDSIKQSVENS